jgi:predicted TIM-barrel fold metal-dependent hydrolase
MSSPGSSARAAGGDHLPPGACDCHVHVFGDPSRFPYAPDRRYTPARAETGELAAHADRLGIDRIVIVQPSPYGTDNACTLDAVAALDGRARAVAVIDESTSADELQALHAGGVRGVRLNLETAGSRDPARAQRLLGAAAEQIGALGWHLQLFAHIDVIAALAPAVPGLGVPLVIDHFGQAQAADGPGATSFRRLLDLLAAGHAYVKLSAPHRVSRAAGLEDVAPLVHAMLRANPERLVWGSDWPHPRGGTTISNPSEIEAFDTIDDALALQRLQRWVDDPALLKRILVSNPALLYDFQEGT